MKFLNKNKDEKENDIKVNFFENVKYEKFSLVKKATAFVGIIGICSVLSSLLVVNLSLSSIKNKKFSRYYYGLSYENDEPNVSIYSIKHINIDNCSSGCEVYLMSADESVQENYLFGIEGDISLEEANEYAMEKLGIDTSGLLIEYFDDNSEEVVDYNNVILKTKNDHDIKQLEKKYSL